MFEQKIGSVVVTSKEEKPVGIITERDLVTRVLAKNCDPKNFLAKEVMSSPLITINPKVMVGKPTIRGMRITVEQILRALAGGLTVDELLQDYPELEQEDIQAVFAYAVNLVDEEQVFPVEFSA